MSWLTAAKGAWSWQGSWLYYSGSSLRLAADRGKDSGIVAAVTAIREAVAIRGMLGLMLKEPAEDQCIAMVDFLRVTAWPPELLVFSRSLARRKACLKLRLQGGAGGKDQSRAYALSTRILEALAHFPAVMRLLEGAGGKIELREPEILEVLGTAARQLALVGEREIEAMFAATQHVVSARRAEPQGAQRDGEREAPLTPVSRAARTSPSPRTTQSARRKRGGMGEEVVGRSCYASGLNTRLKL